MNFLAHAYLSFNQPELVVGNMISDFVKGKKKFEYSAAIQKGIMLHRAIDTFTDDHPVTKEAKLYLKEAVGAYSGAFIDVVYDHFLAIDPLLFTDETLKQFSDQTYSTLQRFKSVLPDRFSQMLPYMISYNWLYNYRHTWGIQRSFEGITRRAKFLHSSNGAFKSFNANYEPLQNCYNRFFPLLREFADQYVQIV